MFFGNMINRLFYGIVSKNQITVGFEPEVLVFENTGK